jgi:hypothetical protein
MAREELLGFFDALVFFLFAYLRNNSGYVSSSHRCFAGKRVVSRLERCRVVFNNYPHLAHTRAYVPTSPTTPTQV